jgi:alpha-tubulin suppressor-like RCC1 family protein
MPIPDAPNVDRVRCVANTQTLVVQCAAVENARAATTFGSLTPAGSPVLTTAMAGVSHIFGGQGQYVSLVSSAVTYAGGTFSFNTTVQNLTNLPMATADGAARDDAGVRVFIQTGPTTTSGSGTITVANATGTATFLSTNQSYYQYGGKIGGVDQNQLGGDGILSSSEVSAAKNWQFSVPGSVTTFTFEVYVATTTTSGTATPSPFLATALASGAMHTCALISTGAAYCWGRNMYGEVGGGASPQRFPSAVVGGITFTSLTAGWAHTCGLTSAGVAYCWGSNNSGNLGDGTKANRSAPVAVTGGLTFTTLAGGFGGTCGLTTNGTAYCWGFNADGELGDGTTVNRLGPVAVLGGHVFSAIASGGGGATCGLTMAGAAYCWGSNGFGQLGDSTTTNRTVPVAVRGGLVFTTLALGQVTSCGITSGGTAYCWGDNEFGGSGDGSSLPRHVPVPVAGGLTFSRIANGGGQHMCGMTTVGAEYCWGLNNFGQIGDGTTANRTVPVPVNGGIVFTSQAAGLWHTCGIANTSVVYCWGRNDVGQLGDLTALDRPSPGAVTHQ